MADEQPTKVWTLAALLHVAADSADEAVGKVQDGLYGDGPATITTSPGRSMEFLYLNLPEEAQYAYDLADINPEGRHQDG